MKKIPVVVLSIGGFELCMAAFSTYFWSSDGFSLSYYDYWDLLYVVPVCFALLMFWRLHFAYVAYRIILAVRITSGIVFLIVLFASLDSIAFDELPIEALYLPFIYVITVIFYVQLRKRPTRQWFERVL